MYGVVLWSDKANGRALIWCEDHGNLAYFNALKQDVSTAQKFDEGDLVTFDVTEGREMRVARDVAVVASEEYPFLARELREATRGGSGPPPPESEATRGVKGNVLPFQPGRRPEPGEEAPRFDVSRKRVSL